MPTGSTSTSANYSKGIKCVCGKAITNYSTLCSKCANELKKGLKKSIKVNKMELDRKQDRKQNGEVVAVDPEEFIAEKHVQENEAIKRLEKLIADPKTVCLTDESFLLDPELERDPEPEPLEIISCEYCRHYAHPDNMTWLPADYDPLNMVPVCAGCLILREKPVIEPAQNSPTAPQSTEGLFMVVCVLSEKELAWVNRSGYASITVQLADPVVEWVRKSMREGAARKKIFKEAFGCS